MSKRRMEYEITLGPGMVTDCPSFGYVDMEWDKSIGEWRDHEGNRNKSAIEAAFVRKMKRQYGLRGHVAYGYVGYKTDSGLSPVCTYELDWDTEQFDPPDES